MATPAIPRPYVYVPTGEQSKELSQIGEEIAHIQQLMREHISARLRKFTLDSDENVQEEVREVVKKTTDIEGLIEHYSLDEQGGRIANNRTSPENSSSLRNQVQWTKGVRNLAIVLDQGGYLDLGNIIDS